MEKIAVSNKAETRKEKKARNGCLGCLKNRKLDKFEVSMKDKEIVRRRKSKKSTKHNHPKVFPKSEAIFNKWFVKNKHRFNHKLIRAGTNCFKFEGIIKEIELLISLNTALEAEFSFTCYDDKYKEDGCFDLIPIEYIGKEGYHPQKGYFDMDRVDGVYTYFPTREELYINEVFEKIINDCNSKLIAENSLYMFVWESATSAYIEPTDESKSKMSKIKNLVSKEVLEKQKIIQPDAKIIKVLKYNLFKQNQTHEVKYFVL